MRLKGITAKINAKYRDEKITTEKRGYLSTSFAGVLWLNRMQSHDAILLVSSKSLPHMLGIRLSSYLLFVLVLPGNNAASILTAARTNPLQCRKTPAVYISTSCTHGGNACRKILMALGYIAYL